MCLMDLSPSSSPSQTLAPPAPPARRRPSRRRRAGEALLVLAITLVLTLVLLEIGLRLFAPQYSPEMRADFLAGLFTPDPAAGYRNTPGARINHQDDEMAARYVINGQGMREDHDVGPPAPGTTRLLVLGDSFAFGLGVPGDGTFPRLLGSAPDPGNRAADGSSIESLNGAVSGYGPDNEAAWLGTYGWPLRPKIVLLAFFVGNDVRDAMLGIDKTYVDAEANLSVTDTVRLAMGAAPDPANSNPAGATKIWLAHHSQAYVFLRALAHNLADFLAPHPGGPPKPGPYDTAPFYYAAAPPEIGAGWDKTLGILDQMRGETEAHGARFVVVAIPTREQVEDSYWQSMRDHFGLSESTLQRDAPQRRLAAWSQRTGAPLIDLLPGFRAAGSSPPRYFRRDPHWNAAGHALAAQLIRAGMVRLGLFGR